MATRSPLSDEMKYQLLWKISHELKATLDLQIVMNHILDTIQTVIPFDAGGIFVLNRAVHLPNMLHSGTMIGGVAQRGFDDGPPENDPMLFMGQGIIGNVIKTSRSILLKDVTDDPRYVAGRQATRSEIAVPIQKDGQTIGALNLESDSPAAFDQNDLAIAVFFADAASIAIEKSILHQELLEKRRIEEQLTIANAVQARLLPRHPPELKDYRIDAICIPCNELGGDYFDFITLDSHRTGIAIADVAGKGIPAALIISAFRVLVRTHARQTVEPAAMGLHLNQELSESIRKRDFVAASYAVLDTKTHRITYANYGNTPPVLIRRDGSYRELDTGGPILGIFRDVYYDDGSFEMQPGDSLVMYTDGIIECLNADMQLYGFDRFMTLLRGIRSKSPRDMILDVLRDTAKYTGSKNYADDLTLIILQRIAE